MKFSCHRVAQGLQREVTASGLTELPAAHTELAVKMGFVLIVCTLEIAK